ncbi:hypothetical protein IP88_06380 [alpha proteobacterium AAP81b]|nr:hypothetical protein IP88_06380 [alpha proteobacterium AAP81b]
MPRPGQPGYIRPSPDLGKTDAQCRAGEAGPAIVVTVDGFRDRVGMARVEVYPPTDEDFLQADNKLVMAGKLFRRVEVPVTPSGPMQLCIRVPSPGNYTLSVLHDRDSNHKYGLSVDGVGVPNNPRICFGKPRAAAVTFRAGPGITTLPITLQYRRSLFCLGPHNPG